MSASVLAIIVMMVLLNSLLAAYELALASSRPERLRALAAQQRRGAAAAVYMKERIEASLAVIQLGITFVGAIAAATGGANAEEQISPWIMASATTHIRCTRLRPSKFRRNTRSSGHVSSLAAPLRGSYQSVSIPSPGSRK